MADGQSYTREYGNRKNREYYARNRHRMLEAERQKRRRAPWTYLIARARERAKKYGLEFTIDKSWAQNRWTGACAITGIRFRMFARMNGPTPFSPSIDRIDQAKGYTPENSRIILFALNSMRGTGTDEDMLMIAKAIVENLTWVKSETFAGAALQ